MSTIAVLAAAAADGSQRIAQRFNRATWIGAAADKSNHP